MANHTTFKVGGPADIWVKPEAGCFPDYASSLLQAAKIEGIPVFVLGAGANLVVSDKGIRGIVLDTSGWTGLEPSAEDSAWDSLVFRTGTSVDDAIETAARLSLSGLEFLAGMPGTIGGAVWMNARCYEKSISDALLETEILDEGFSRQKIPFNNDDFGYKKSPFQNRGVLILRASFRLKKGDLNLIKQEMEAHIQDRKEKGHYRFPSAGSAFKNNRAFGEPTGKIIDTLGLRGFSMGGAQVAPWHGNIIINTGNAAASDIRALAEEVTRRVKAERGFDLEPEILFVGDWDV
ncbi:UDP-N-acetylmuramate dehydrogenase [Leadbettera azotonutricia ZAS-9]|uniref:UDP-N-acetylenolpyruvoylglucosamine reductase n=2 Tax=Leadbettera azotonutricia TaxID=150829 RepID=F5YA65_LEAAZ|nr:UDP-N-acetylmuramate dehydrogenase [Leadbettera azotonutricia ZAS-9]